MSGKREGRERGMRRGNGNGYRMKIQMVWGKYGGKGGPGWGIGFWGGGRGVEE